MVVDVGDSPVSAFGVTRRWRAQRPADKISQQPLPTPGNEQVRPQAVNVEGQAATGAEQAVGMPQCLLSGLRGGDHSQCSKQQEGVVELLGGELVEFTEIRPQEVGVQAPVAQRLGGELQ